MPARLLVPGVTSAWSTYEVLLKNAGGTHSVTPVSDALASAGGIPPQPITKIRLVQAIGWPLARWSLKDDFGRPLIVRRIRHSLDDDRTL